MMHPLVLIEHDPEKWDRLSEKIMIKRTSGYHALSTMTIIAAQGCVANCAVAGQAAS